MKDQSKTKQASIHELASLREKITELEQAKSERKQTEKAIEKERERMEVILSALDTGLSLINPDMTIAWVNQKVREMFPGSEPVGQVCHVFYESRETICDGCGTLLAFMNGKICESEQLVPATGRWYYIISQPIKDAAGRVVNVLEGITDITERKQAEMEIARVNRALRMLSNTNQAVIHITDEATLLNEVCRIAVEVGGYLLAWVGFAEYDEAKTLRPAAHAGFDSEYIESAKVTWADNERGRGLGGTAIRTGQPCIVRNIPVDPSFAPWREEATRRGYKSIIALPLTIEGQAFGAIGIYSAEADAFDDREVEILKELADDLAFGINALRTRAERDLAEEALHETKDLYKMLTEKAIAGVYVVQDGKFRFINSNAASYAGYTREELLDREASILVHPEDSERVRQNARAMLLGEMSFPYEFRIITKQGETRWIMETVTSIFHEGRPAILGNSMNITERRRMEEALQENQNRLTDIVTFLPDATLAIDKEMRIIIWNKAIEEMTGVPAAEMIGKGDYAYTIPFYGEARPQLMDLVFLDRMEIASRYPNITHEGDSITAEAFCKALYNNKGAWVFAKASPLHDQSGNIIGAIEIVRNITVQKQAEEKILQLAYHDSLTGLPNRKLFSDRLGMALTQAQRNQKGVAVAMIDLDNFKGVNDTLGHDRGDLLLKEAAERLSAALRKGDTVARFGGDEFVLILPDLKGTEDVIQVVQKIIKSFRKPFPIETHELLVTASIGIAVYPHDGIDEGILLKNADIAMYQAKQTGRDRYQICPNGAQ